MEKLKCKKLIGMLLALTITASLSTGFPSSADSRPVGSLKYDQIETKQDLVDYANQEESLKSQQTKNSNSSVDTNKMLADMVFVGDDIDTIASAMENYGVYIYDSESGSSTMSAMSTDVSDVKVSAPIISYNSSKRQWTVTGGGYWKNTSYINDVGLLSHNIGGNDAFGVGYTSTSGTYSSAVVSLYGYIENADCTVVKSTTDRTDGDGKSGFGFRLQDYVIPSSIPYAAPDYVGYRFCGQCIYNSNFTNYHGNATTYYVHTWNNTAVSSVSFGISGKVAEINVSLGSSTDYFLAYSGADTAF
jgi:hypothetical protein